MLRFPRPRRTRKAPARFKTPTSSTSSTIKTSADLIPPRRRAQNAIMDVLQGVLNDDGNPITPSAARAKHDVSQQMYSLEWKKLDEKTKELWSNFPRSSPLPKPQPSTSSPPPLSEPSAEQQSDQVGNQVSLFSPPECHGG